MDGVFLVTKIAFKAEGRANGTHTCADFFARQREKKEFFDPDREQQHSEAWCG